MSNEARTSWARLLLEGLAIVLSILLAFAIDAAWEDRQDRGFEQETLQALQEEYRNHREVLVAHREGHLAIRRAVAALVAACRDGTYDSDEASVDVAMHVMRIPATTELVGGARDALINSGRLGAISNRTLRFQLAEWRSVADELVDDQQAGVRMVFDFILPYLTRHGVPITVYGDPEALRTDTPLDGVSRLLSEDAAAMQRLFGDPEFLSILEARYDLLTHTTGEFDALIQATDAIILSITDSLGD
jgi:hypothetical protein